MKNANREEAIQRYIKKYAYGQYEAELSKPTTGIDTIIVIPAIDEYENIKRLLLSLIRNEANDLKHALFIFVVNNALSASQQVKDQNTKTVSLLQSIMTNKRGDDVLHQITSSEINIGIVDLSSSGNELPDKTAGVGLARKIGMDAALPLFPAGCAHPILVCLDADCTVSQNYLSVIRLTTNREQIEAAVIQYEHPFENLEEEAREAIVCYELFLRYYTLGLIYARSPYSFHTIGSTIVCSVDAYMKAEGMNKKKAGEDFYFLEKVGKMFPVHTLNDARVYPSARGSWRVPFGTGQRIDRHLRGEQDEYQLYNPRSFSILKEWLSFFLSSEASDVATYLTGAKKLDAALYNFLEENNFRIDWTKIFSGPRHQFAIQKKIWFDGFRTLKFIHYLRDNGYPNVSMFEAIDALALLMDTSVPVKRENVIPDIDIQIQYLQWGREASITPK